MEIEIPNYVNGKPSSLNAELIKTALWLRHKGFMESEEMHNALKCYETSNLATGSEMMQLTEKVVNTSLRPLGRIVPTSLFVMWCKKCWQFLTSSKTIKMPSNEDKKKQDKEKAQQKQERDNSWSSDENIPNLGLSNYDEFRDFGL